MHTATKYQLTIILPIELRVTARVYIFNSANQTVYVGKVKSIPSLPKGLYLVRVVLAGQFQDKNVILNKDITVQFEDLKVYSSLPFSNSPYYETSTNCAAIAREQSGNNTFINPRYEEGNHSSLFIFLYYPRKYSSSSLEIKSVLNDYKLYDSAANIFCEFSLDTARESLEEGWLAFKTQLNPGCYYFSYEGRNPRQMPVYIFKNWHTQILMIIEPEPNFGTLRVFLSRNPFYNLQNEEVKITDILLDKIQNEDYSLDDYIIDRVANGKYEHPEFGLLCIYAYLKGTANAKDHLFEIMLDNLEGKILRTHSAPDLVALRLLEDIYHRKTIEPRIVNTPPLLRIGFESLLHASITQPDIIPENSINDYISENLLYDSPWTTFRPVLHKVKESLVAIPPNNSDVILAKKADTGKIRLNQASLKEIKVITGLTEEGEDKELLQNENDNWIANTIDHLSKKNPEMKIKDLSTHLNLSGNTINRVIKSYFEDNSDGSLKQRPL